MSSTRQRAAAFFLAGIMAAAATGSLAQTSDNMTLLGSLKEYAQYSDIWGYADGSGREYAIVGTIGGTTIVNVTDPANAYETGFIPGATSAWRDMKTYGSYAYLVTEGGGGMQIVDLTDPESPQELAPYLGFFSAHNIYIEEATARAYPCGTDNAVGFHVLDLSDPTQPTLLGSYATTYVHDLYVRNDIAYVAEIYDGTLSIFDVTNPSASVRLAGPIAYPGAVTHNTWLTNDGRYLLTTDEVQGARVRVWDVQSFSSISQVGSYQAPAANSIVHNVTVRGDRAYIAYYTEGIRVVDISDPAMPTEVGYYDSWSGSSGGYNGAWGVYPYLPSRRVLVSDIQSGLLILSVDDTPVVGVAEDLARPVVPTLDAFPNPFNPSTLVRFELSESTPIRLDIHDLRGRRITNLVDRDLAAGVHAVRWDGRDAAGRAMASGVYLAVLRTQRGQRTQKLVLAK